MTVTEELLPQHLSGIELLLATILKRTELFWQFCIEIDGATLMQAILKNFQVIRSILMIRYLFSKLIW